MHMLEARRQESNKKNTRRGKRRRNGPGGSSAGAGAGASTSAERPQAPSSNLPTLDPELWPMRRQARRVTWWSVRKTRRAMIQSTRMFSRCLQFSTRFDNATNTSMDTALYVFLYCQRPSIKVAAAEYFPRTFKCHPSLFNAMAVSIVCASASHITSKRGRSAARVLELALFICTIRTLVAPHHGGHGLLRQPFGSFQRFRRFW